MSTRIIFQVLMNVVTTAIWIVSFFFSKKSSNLCKPNFMFRFLTFGLFLSSIRIDLLKGRQVKLSNYRSNKWREQK